MIKKTDNITLNGINNMMKRLMVINKTGEHDKLAESLEDSKQYFKRGSNITSQIQQDIAVMLINLDQWIKTKYNNMFPNSFEPSIKTRLL